jgi:signal transduction histidine kinase
VLRTGMQRMAGELEAGRRAALEAERLSALRESARQVAHELKNPLTPIRFAIARLRGHVPHDLDETVAVLDAESARLEQMAKSFAQFGRLPDGPIAEVDVGELIANALRVSVPDSFGRDVHIEPALPPLMGQHDALGRALGNVLLNAVEACGTRGGVTVSAGRATLGSAPAIVINVRDDGPGIDPAKLQEIWNPYVTNKAGGTGLGLAIVRQTIEAHGGVVAAANAPGKGMVITLTLPAGAARPADGR